LKKDLFVVAPPGTIIDTWKTLAERYHIGITCISYDMLSGKSDRCNHDYLIKCADGKDYTPTPTLLELINKGTIFVFDESDEAKNPKSQRLLACQAISRAITSKVTPSKIILLSATPIDKKIFAESVVKLLGIVKHKQLYQLDEGTREYRWKEYGYGDIYRYCCLVDKKGVSGIHPLKINKMSISNAIYSMLCQIIKHRVGTSMPKAKLTAKFYPEIRYYSVPTDELARFKENINNLRKTIESESSGDRVIIMEYLQTIESGMLSLISKIIEDKLKQPNKKLIVYVWFDHSVDHLMERFKEYSPLRCDGKVDPNIRTDYIKLFQENNAKYRLIIAKPTSFAKGINLDDTIGDFPRDIICVPDFRFNLIHQAAGRTHRSLTKSDSTFSLIFIKDADTLDILKVLAEKSVTTSEVVIDKCDSNNKVIYPGDYPIFIN
jgi:hypothetical protein